MKHKGFSVNMQWSEDMVAVVLDVRAHVGSSKEGAPRWQSERDAEKTPPSLQNNDRLAFIDSFKGWGILQRSDKLDCRKLQKLHNGVKIWGKVKGLSWAKGAGVETSVIV